MSQNKALRVVLATSNAGKVRELADPLTQFGVEVVGLSSFPEIGEIEENGTTFEEKCLWPVPVALGKSLRKTQRTVQP